MGERGNCWILPILYGMFMVLMGIVEGQDTLQVWAGQGQFSSPGQEAPERCTGFDHAIGMPLLLSQM
jgi:hypothetical protein